MPKQIKDLRDVADMFPKGSPSKLLLDNYIDNANQKPKKKKIKSKTFISDLLPFEGPGRDEYLILYSWAEKDAQKAQDEWLKSGAGTYLRGWGPFFKWQAANELKELYTQFRAGKKEVLIKAMRVCAGNSLVMPVWVKNAFELAYSTIQSYDAKIKSWDDVFGPPHLICPDTKKRHLDSLKLEKDISKQVYHHIVLIKQKRPRTPINIDLFEKVGKKFKIKKTLVGEYYSKWKKIIESQA
jgi:hypothetical protein